MAQLYKRSNKPIVWGLFAAGGTITAFIVPALMLALGLAVPLGLLDVNDLGYQRIYDFVFHPLMRLVLFGFITLAFWHSAHRIRTTAHDLGIDNDKVTLRICYGLASIGTMFAAAALFLS